MTNLILRTRGFRAAEGDSSRLIDNRGICPIRTSFVVSTTRFCPGTRGFSRNQESFVSPAALEHILSLVSERRDRHRYRDALL
mmetsp:Transcript_14912/g.62954  ORF Transcript_14912/g.62954 Transcript_14912/m.62954 type:complete len:83 (+) Transcript_14912:11-259(+)